MTLELVEREGREGKEWHRKPIDAAGKDTY